MKSKIAGMVMLVSLVAGAGPAAELKVGVVDTVRILKEYYKTDLAERHVQQQMDDFSAERDKLLVQHKKMKQEFEALRAESENKALTDEAREKKKEQAEEKLTAVMAFENSIRDKVASRKRELESEGRKIQGELGRAIKDAIRTVSEKNGCTLVLSQGGLLANGLESVLYADPRMDLTDEVLKVLNADKTAAGKE